MLTNRHSRAPQVATDSTRRSAVAWSPDGGALLAAPGRDNDAVLLERLSWKAAQYLSGVHTAEVNTLAFSPNGARPPRAQLPWRAPAHAGAWWWLRRGPVLRRAAV